MKNILIAAAIVAVASVNVYIMNDVNLNDNSDLSLLTLENVAEADEQAPSEGGGIPGRDSKDVGKENQESVYNETCGTCGLKCTFCDYGYSNCKPYVCGHLIKKYNGGSDGYTHPRK